MARLMRNCRGKGELLFVIQDVKDGIFGGYFSQNLEAKPDYFGTGESFLFVVKVALAHEERPGSDGVPGYFAEPLLLLLQH